MYLAKVDLTGPGGLARESFTTDMRKVVTAFRGAKGEIASERIEIRKFDGKKAFDEKPLAQENYKKLVWMAATNKYFGVILVPVSREGKDFCEWIPPFIEDQTGARIPCRKGRLYNPDAEKNSGDESLGLYLRVAPGVLDAKGGPTSEKTYKFHLYISIK